MTYDEGLAVLERRGKFATIVLWVFVAVATLTAIGELLEALGVVNIELDLGPLALAIGLTYIAHTAVFIASIVLVGMWIHRAHTNLRDGGADGLEFTPGWAVGWYFIPFANLVMPFKAMRELWNASHGAHDPFGGTAASVVKAWWAAWIVGNIVSSIGTRVLVSGDGGSGSVTAGNAIGCAGTTVILVAALLLIRIIDAVTRAQRGGGSAAAVFA